MQVGDYVRTKNGEIVKCFKSESMNKPIYYVIGSATNSYIEYQDIVKSSPNIIDLIEAGDYVNGLKVSRVGGTYHGRKDKAIYCDYCMDKETKKWTMIYDDEIKSIVTKEQFEAMEYKVGVDKE